MISSCPSPSDAVEGAVAALSPIGATRIQPPKQAGSRHGGDRSPPRQLGIALPASGVRIIIEQGLPRGSGLRSLRRSSAAEGNAAVAAIHTCNMGGAKAMAGPSQADASLQQYSTLLASHRLPRAWPKVMPRQLMKALHRG